MYLSFEIVWSTPYVCQYAIYTQAYVTVYCMCVIIVNAITVPNSGLSYA